jgi:hypothetical protein
MGRLKNKQDDRPIEDVWSDNSPGYEEEPQTFIHHRLYIN